MRRTVKAATVIAADTEGARALWTDVRRWPTFVEGFAHVVEASRDWPREGARLVWVSNPSGRGRVTEKVVERSHERFVTEVFEERLRGTQTAEFGRAPGGGAHVALALDYELSRGGPLRAITDVAFIRRSLRAALGRTLRRFAVEAEEEAGLR